MRTVSPALVTLAALLPVLTAAPARADGGGDAPCTATSPTELRVAADEFPLELWKKPALIYAYSRLPIDGEAQIGVAGQKMPAETAATPAQDGAPGPFSTLRVLVTDAESADLHRPEAAARMAASPGKEKIEAARVAFASADREATNKEAAAALSSNDADKKAAVDARKKADTARNALAEAIYEVGKPDFDKVETNFISGLQVAPSSAESDNALVRDKKIALNSLLISFTVPSPYENYFEGRTFWRPARLTVIACDKADRVVFISSQKSVSLSSRWACWTAGGLSALIVYVLMALASRAFDSENKAGHLKPANGRLAWLEDLNPVWMTSGPDGKGSLARLQILFFSFLIASILAFLILRIGYLSDMSTTIVTLLGISAFGAAAAKATDGAQTRLRPENWAWLTSRKWLPEKGLAPYRKANWSDLVTSEDGFDVYHFQVLVFSLVVGLALLLAGYTDLAGFRIPDALLGVLGLSQVAYVGGKLVSPPSFGDLDKLISEIRKLEEDFNRLCFKANSIDGTSDEAKKAKAAAVADKEAAEKAFLMQMKKVETYFITVFGTFDEIKQLTNTAAEKKVDPDTSLPSV